MLREKIHHLDDMLKSQQRKVRQMIEQVRGAGPGSWGAENERETSEGKELMAFGDIIPRQPQGDAAQAAGEGIKGEENRERGVKRELCAPR